MVSGDLLITLSASGLSGPDAMEPWMKRSLAVLFSFVAMCSVSASAFAGSMMLMGAGKPPAAASYTGPGDITNTYLAWGSCAFVYKALLANMSTNMCDLVASTGGAAVCTLRGSASGAVDQSGYCPGGLTPSAACAAASGGSCLVTKVYDQTGHSVDLLQATLSAMPSHP
jgi:hypothetical protein